MIMVAATIITTFFFLVALFSYIFLFRKEKKIIEKANLLKFNAANLSPKEFFKLRNECSSLRSNISSRYNFAGVYILHNLTKDMYYVGQSNELMNRINSHFTGSGNGDVYADFKYGDEFSIKIISLEESGYHNLNELEHDMIFAHNAHNKGYNKTRGNRS